MQEQGVPFLDNFVMVKIFMDDQSFTFVFVSKLP